MEAADGAVENDEADDAVENDEADDVKSKDFIQPNFLHQQKSNKKIQKSFESSLQAVSSSLRILLVTRTKNLLTNS